MLSWYVSSVIGRERRETDVFDPRKESAKIEQYKTTVVTHETGKWSKSHLCLCNQIFVSRPGDNFSQVLHNHKSIGAGSISFRIIWELFLIVKIFVEHFLQIFDPKVSYQNICQGATWIQFEIFTIYLFTSISHYKSWN